MPKPIRKFSKERKIFIQRMLQGRPKNFALEMKTAYELFEMHEFDLNFFEKVSPPPFKINSLLWFKTRDGLKFLAKKKMEMKFQVPEYEKVVEIGEKCGEDTLTEIKPRTIRKFLNG